MSAPRRPPGVVATPADSSAVVGCSSSGSSSVILRPFGVKGYRGAAVVIVRVDVAKRAGVEWLAVLEIHDIAVIACRRRHSNRGRQALVDEAIRGPPVKCCLAAPVRPARLDPDVVIENCVHRVPSRLTRRLHRCHACERLGPRACKHHRIIVHLIAAVTGLPDTALLQIFEPVVLVRDC